MKESFRHFEHKKVDLIGLGNAIVDIIVNVEDEFLEIHNLDKGSMNLINSDESQRLLENCKVIKQISGGSSANTVVSLAELGNHVQFIGRVKNDQFGNFFSEDIKNSKTIFNTPPTVEGASTAHSIILITPDAQRTMCTYLGASIEFETEDIDFSVIKESKYLYLEGYLWDSELAKKAFIKAAQIAKQSNTKIILSLSDSFCVDSHRESNSELINEYIKENKINGIIADHWKSLELIKTSKKKYCLIHSKEINHPKGSSQNKRVVSILNNVEKVIANSQFTKNLAIELGVNENKVIVINPGVDPAEELNKKTLDKVESILKVKNPRLITVSRFDKRKNHEKIIMALRNLKQIYPDIVYICVGYGEEEENIKKLVKELDLETQVMFFKNISNLNIDIVSLKWKYIGAKTIKEPFNKNKN